MTVENLTVTFFSGRHGCPPVAVFVFSSTLILAVTDVPPLIPIIRVTAWLLCWGFGGFTWTAPHRFSCSFSPGQLPFSALPGHVKAIEILSQVPVFWAIGAFFCHPEWIRGFKISLSVQMASKTRLMWASKLHEAPNELFRSKRIDWLWRVCVITVPVQYLFMLILPYIAGILNPLHDLHRVTTI